MLNREECCVGMRVLSPTMNRWPAWADVFPNIALVPKVEAKTLVMHVSLPPAPIKTPKTALACASNLHHYCQVCLEQ